MQSQAVAAYIYQVGDNQRRTEYCRQMLVSNPNFIPECVFNLKDRMNTNTQSKIQFIANLKNLELGCSEQGQTLIFNYFQIDGKSYITFGEFQEFTFPQNDTAIKKIVANRKRQEFVFDYALRYSLHKFFFQVIQNQVNLELMCKFTFPKANRDDHKLKNKRLDVSALLYFMKVHGKYPDQKFAQMMTRELNLNKGDCKRNRLIVEFINQFNDKHKKNEKLPEVLKKAPVVISMTRKKDEKQNKAKATTSKRKFDFSSSKIGANPLLANTPAQILAVSSIVPSGEESKYNPLSNISDVQKRIDSLMGEVKNSSPIKQMASSKKHKWSKEESRKEEKPEKIMKGSAVESVKRQLQREKASRVNSSRVNSSDLSQNLGLRSGNLVSKKRQSNEDKFLTDRGSRRNDLDFEAVTQKYQTDRIRESRPSRREDSFDDSNQESQLIFKPKSRIMSGSLKASPEFKSHSRDMRGEEPYKKRIQYLKNLVKKNP